VLTLCLVLASLAALIHVLFFTMESLLYSRPAVHGRFGTRPQDVEATRPWAFNQGFYNLFLAVGTLVGVVLAAGDEVSTGLALVLFGCGSMVAASLVLVVPQPQMARAAAVQGVLPALAVALAVVELTR
jgi:putative membrane protein